VDEGFRRHNLNRAVRKITRERATFSALAEAAREAGEVAAAVELSENIKFQRARGLIRAAMRNEKL
jgi:hypothetical protein